MGTLLCSCVEVHEPIELSFGIVSGVSRVIDVLDGVPHASRGRGGFLVCLPPLAQWMGAPWFQLHIF